jgi:ABC-2 type transport system permease protein
MSTATSDSRERARGAAGSGAAASRTQRGWGSHRRQRGIVGTGHLLRVQWRIRRRWLVVWVVALVGSLAGTAVSIAGLYDTPAKVQTYADAVASDALVAINGRVEGIDSLGGIIQDEFSFMAAFLLPLFGISLVAALTRREEESGRLETLLAGRADRRAPVVAALLLATGAIALTVIGFTVSLAASGVPFDRSLLYALSLGLLAFVFAALAALFAQVVLHSRGVYGGGLAVLVAAYVLRGVGDVTHSWVAWLSPLGWAERAAPFGPMRWWTLAIPLVVGLGLSLAAVRVASSRDLGSALLRGGAGPERAGRRLAGPFGLATRLQWPTLAGWLAGTIALAVTMGALAQEVIDAVLGNPALASALGASGNRPEDAFVALVVLYLAIVGAGYVVQATGVLRREETDGRLEPRLAGDVSRWHWLGINTAVVLGGLVVLVALGSLVFAAATAWSTGDSRQLGRILGAGLAYLPAQLVLAGLALALFGAVPRWFGLAWAAYGVITFIAFLGPGLNLPGWVLDLAPTTHVGNPPSGSVEAVALAVLTAVGVALLVGAFAGFRRRGIPQG